MAGERRGVLTGYGRAPRRPGWAMLSNHVIRVRDLRQEVGMELLEVVVNRTRVDEEARRLLTEIVRLDQKLMPSGMAVRMADPLQSEYLAEAARLSNLYDEFAARIAGPDDDTDYLATWISYKCHDVASALH